VAIPSAWTYFKAMASRVRCGGHRKYHEGENWTHHEIAYHEGEPRKVSS